MKSFVAADGQGFDFMSDLEVVEICCWVRSISQKEEGFVFFPP